MGIGMQEKRGEKILFRAAFQLIGYKGVTFFYVTFVTFFYVDEGRIRYYRKYLLDFANETNV